MASKSKKISANKNTKKTEKKNETVVPNNELKKLLKITLIICGVLLVFYFITVLVQNEDNDDNKESNNTAVIQYNKILVGEILNRSENEYYVLVEKENDSYIDLYKQYLTSVKETVYYTVNLSEVFNQNKVGDETIVEGNEVGNYKFAETTLIKVTNNTLNGVYKNKAEITEYLKSL
jgi:hypothetical protein